MLKRCSVLRGLELHPRTLWRVNVSCTGQPPSTGTCQSCDTPVMLVRKLTKRPSGAKLGPEALRMLRKRSMPNGVAMLVLREEIVQQPRVPPVLRDDEVGPGPDEPLPLPFVDPLPSRLV